MIRHSPKIAAMLGGILPALFASGCGERRSNWDRPAFDGPLRETALLAQPAVIIDKPDLSRIPDSGGIPEDFPAGLEEALSAIGQLVVRPFSNPREAIRCTATHLGNGFVLTSGHCLLGAHRCNGAEITFPFADLNHANPGANQGVWRSRCLEVIDVASNDSAFGGPGEDYAVLKIDHPPPAALAVDIDSEIYPDQNVTVLSAATPAFRRSIWWSGPCKIQETRPRAFNGRPLSALSFTHDCDTTLGSNGAALIDAENLRIIGIHQSGFALEQDPVEAPPYLKSFNAAKRLSKSKVSELLRALQWPSFSPQIGYTGTVEIGAYAAEAFPFGFPEPVAINVVRFEREAGRTVSLEITTGPRTDVRVYRRGQLIDRILGVQNLAALSPKRYRTPISITATSMADARSASVVITRVDSP